ncbi:hypothetical protein ACIBEJ_45850 [Nonomuraea sp. NPDC050790]|uniref:PIN-like domain-containing protein n=1 Tax=Nonomuraea sp. NPDC050790 TaxID=3364371 RepID=UPI00379211DD
MRLLLDENVPRPLHQVLTSFVLNHDVIHLLDLPGWSGTRDETLYPRATAEGFHVVLTNDGRQMQRPREVAAIAASGLHRIEYPHKHPGGRDRHRDRDGRRWIAERAGVTGRIHRTPPDHAARRRPHGSEPAADDRSCTESAEILAYVSVAWPDRGNESPTHSDGCGSL